MTHNLTKSRNISTFHIKNLQKNINGHHFYTSAATSSSAFSELGSQIRGCQGQNPPRKLSNCSSLSLYGMLHSATYHSFCSSHFQVPLVLPHSTTLCLQEVLPVNSCMKYRPLSYKSLKFVDLESNPCKLVFKYRGYCSDVKDDVNSDEDDGGDGDDVNSDEGAGNDRDEGDEGDEGGEGDEGSEGGRRKADPKEVQRVVKLIDDLFGLDHSMEAALDECGVDLTHDLVVAVLETFKHARKPAFRFFCWVGGRPGFSHDSVTYNKMMEVLGKTRQFETMISVIEEMGEKGLLTLETFQFAIKAFAAAKHIKKAEAVFPMMKKYKFKVGVNTINLLLDELGKAKLGREAYTMFRKLEHRFAPNIRTYTILLDGWCLVKNLTEAGKIWNLMIDKGFKPDIVAHNTLLEGLLKCNNMSDSIKLFEVMKAKGPPPNVKTYTIFIRVLCKKGKMGLAIRYFSEMLDFGCEPDVALYTCLISGFGHQRRMTIVYRLLVEMKEEGYPPDAQLYNALIKLMSIRGMPDEIVKCYKKMIRDGLQPTINTYNMMLKSYFIARDHDMASAVWKEMKRRGCCPDENSYRIMVCGLIRLGRSVEGCEFLEEMLERGMRAPQLDYNKFAADFSRAGKPNIFEELSQKKKCSGNSEVSDVFARWAMMRKRVMREPIRTEDM